MYPCVEASSGPGSGAQGCTSGHPEVAVMGTPVSVLGTLPSRSRLPLS